MNQIEIDVKLQPARLTGDESLRSVEENVGIRTDRERCVGQQISDAELHRNSLKRGVDFLSG